MTREETETTEAGRITTTVMADGEEVKITGTPVPAVVIDRGQGERKAPAQDNIPGKSPIHPYRPVCASPLLC